MKLQQIIFTTTMAAVLTACGGGSDSASTTADAISGTGTTTDTTTGTATGTTASLAYTVYANDLSVSAQTATIATAGTTVTTSIPLTSTLIATYATSDAGVNYTWSGAAIGGGTVRADGNVALICTGSTMQSGYAAVSSNATKVTDLTQVYGKIFTENVCASTGSVLTVNADGSASNNVGDTFTANETSQIFSPTGLTGPNGGNYRGTVYSFTQGTATRYFYVIQADETSTNGGKKVSVGFQQ